MCGQRVNDAKGANSCLKKNTQEAPNKLGFKFLNSLQHIIIFIKSEQNLFAYDPLVFGVD